MTFRGETEALARARAALAEAQRHLTLYRLRARESKRILAKAEEASRELLALDLKIKAIQESRL